MILRERLISSLDTTAVQMMMDILELTHEAIASIAVRTYGAPRGRSTADPPSVQAQQPRSYPALQVLPGDSNPLPW